MKLIEILRSGSKQLINAYLRKNYGSALITACEIGHYEITEILIEKGANVNHQNSRDWTSALGSFGATLRSMPPITVAAKYGHKEIVELLIDNSAALNATSSNPADYSRGGWESVPDSAETAMVIAARNGHYNIVLTLLKAGAHPNLNNYGGSIWLFAIKNDNLELAELIIHNCSDINIKGQYDETLLYGASGWGYPKIVELLIESGADINAKRSGDTPLHNVKNEQIVRILIDKGADINAKDSNGNSPLRTAIGRGEVDVAKLLIECGADINDLTKPVHEEPYLHWIAYAGIDNPEVVRLLIEYGSDIHSKNNEGKTPLHIASFWGKIEIANYLINEGADIHSQDLAGKTPLHCAAEWRDQNLDVVKLLIDVGANINTKTKKGETALDIAIKKGNNAIVELLQGNETN